MTTTNWNSNHLLKTLFITTHKHIQGNHPSSSSSFNHQWCVCINIFPHLRTHPPNKQTKTHTPTISHPTHICSSPNNNNNNNTRFSHTHTLSLSHTHTHTLSLFFIKFFFLFFLFKFLSLSSSLSSRIDFFETRNNFSFHGSKSVWERECCCCEKNRPEFFFQKKKIDDSTVITLKKQSMKLKRVFFVWCDEIVVVDLLFIFFELWITNVDWSNWWFDLKMMFFLNLVEFFFLLPLCFRCLIDQLIHTLIFNHQEYFTLEN